MIFYKPITEKENIKEIYSNISFDDNLDGIPEWKINCDFGSPLSVVFSDNISLTYKEYPYLSSVIADDISYSLVPNLYEWAPVKFDLNKKLEELIGENSFIVPEPLKTSFDLNQSDLIKYSSSFTCPGYERTEGKIQISTVDGIFQEAKYSSNDKVYATLSFASGLPVTRYVDADNDGYFELTEEYAYSVEEYENFDYSNVYSNLFGPVKFEPGVYLKSISIDLDFDSKQDFKTEYFPNDEKKLTWFDSNGNVFCEYKTQPSLEKSQTLFYMPETNAIVTVEMEKQIPVSVSKQNSDSKDLECLSVTESDGVYWIGNPAISDISGKVKALLEEDGRQGYSIISSYEVNEEGKKDIVTFTAIKINDLYFGVVCE